jgi:hypothetical protein
VCASPQDAIAAQPFTVSVAVAGAASFDGLPVSVALRDQGALSVPMAGALVASVVNGTAVFALNIPGAADALVAEVALAVGPAKYTLVSAPFAVRPAMADRAWLLIADSKTVPPPLVFLKQPIVLAMDVALVLPTDELLAAAAPGDYFMTVSLLPPVLAPPGHPGRLHGTLQRPVVDGVATFTDLWIDYADSGYRLMISCDVLDRTLTTETPPFSVARASRQGPSSLGEHSVPPSPLSLACALTHAGAISARLSTIKRDHVRAVRLYRHARLAALRGGKAARLLVSAICTCPCSGHPRRARSWPARRVQRRLVD